MDPLTHVLLGASASYAIWGRRLGRAAALAGGLAAAAPDSDIFIRSATDPLLAIEYHRGFTHALAFAPVGAAIVAALWLTRPEWRRDGSRWLTLWAACTLAYLTHVLLDASTSYGTQWLWPFTRQRAGWDLISIIDPLFTLTLLIGLCWALVRRQLRPVVVSLTLCAAHLIWGGIQHHRAADLQRALAAARGHTIERAEIMPTVGNNIVWRALYQYQGQIYSDRIRVGWFSSGEVREGWSLPLIKESDLQDHERIRNMNASFERFAWFSDHWVARSPQDPTVLADMRYSLSTAAFDPIWGIRYTETGKANEVDWINRTREREINPGELWSEIRGRDDRFQRLSPRDRQHR